jgi:hypothetical protein
MEVGSMPKILIALTTTVALLLTQVPSLAFAAETATASSPYSVTLVETTAVQELWAPEVWPVDHWSFPFVRVLVEEKVMSVSEVELLNRRVGPNNAISSSAFDTYASRTLKTVLPNRILTSKPVTREQMASTLYRMMTYSGNAVLQTAEELDLDGLHWKDASLFEGYGYHAAVALRSLGIVSGNDGNFEPQRMLTAAEALTVLAKTKVPGLRTLPQLPPQNSGDSESVSEPGDESDDCESSDLPAL